MNSEYLMIYNQAGEMLGVLENAGDISYSLLHNDLWTASFTLPSDDPKNSFCQAHNIVHLPDGNRDTGLYRIVGMPTSEETAAGGLKTYSLEHVMAVLLDDVLFGYHEIGGAQMPTGGVIQYILSRQATQRWVLGECDFIDQFSYKFENTSLLSALLSLGEVILDEFTWVFDTTVTPWVVSLKRADATPGCGIHYMRNMVGIDKSMDASTLVTRLYLLGYGEGVNQLTVKDVNGGLPYIDADTVSQWGAKCSIYVDPRIEDAATLKARGRAILEKLKNPYISYTASAIDLMRVTGQSWDTFMPGKLVKVMDGEHGIDFNARIVSVSKGDLRRRPGEIEIMIANAERDAAGSINTLADRLGINELYSQGATNLYSQQYADNADTAHPAIMRVFVPAGCVRINQMLLSWQTEPFRAYETGAAAGGGKTTTTATGGASTATSAAGGAATVTTEVKVVTNALSTGGPLRSDTGDSMPYVDDNDTQTTVSGGDGTTGAASGNTSSAGSGSTGTASPGTTGPNSASATDHTHTVHSHSHSGPSHSHGLNAHTHAMAGHTHTIASHRHYMRHYHTGVANITIPALSVEIPSHQHTVGIPAHSHSLTLNDHEHGMIFGIYEGGKANGVTLYVDGNLVPAASVTAKEMDIVAYLTKDADGKIKRGAWHEIRIVPDALTRIEANLFVQAFIQSIGGGDY